MSVFDHAVYVFYLVAASVSGEPGGGAPWDSLVGVEFVDRDGRGALAAVFVVDGAYEGSGAVGLPEVSFEGSVLVVVCPGLCVGFDLPAALGAPEPDGTVGEDGDRCPPVLEKIGGVFLYFLVGGVFGY